MNTEIIKIGNEITEETVRKAGEILRRGGIAAFPTDTVYGLGAICCDRAAVRRIFEAKGRPADKPLSILVSDISQVRMLSESIPEEAFRLMEAFWPGALTVILKKSRTFDIPEEVTAGGDTIGVRMPDSEAALRIIEAAGMPLAAPSANISGNRSAACAEDVIQDLYGKCDLILDQGACPVGVSSTIADLSEGEIRILREGVVTREMIDQVLMS